MNKHCNGNVLQQSGLFMSKLPCITFVVLSACSCVLYTMSNQQSIRAHTITGVISQCLRVITPTLLSSTSPKTDPCITPAPSSAYTSCLALAGYDTPLTSPPHHNAYLETSRAENTL